MEHDATDVLMHLTGPATGLSSSNSLPTPAD